MQGDGVLIISTHGAALVRLREQKLRFESKLNKKQALHAMMK